MKTIIESLFVSLLVSIMLMILQWFIEFRTKNRGIIGKLISYQYIIDYNKKVITKLRKIIEIYKEQLQEVTR